MEKLTYVCVCVCVCIKNTTRRMKWQPTLMDRGAWWAALHRVTRSWTRLKRLSMQACIGEGNGNLLQYSCLENSRDGGAWWAAICGVAQNRTQLK